MLTSLTFRHSAADATEIAVWIRLLTSAALVRISKYTESSGRCDIRMLENVALAVHAHDGGAAPPRRRRSHGAPVTQSPDPSFSVVLGCHGSCFTNYPRGHAPTLCPHYPDAVCIVCEIIFQV